MEEKKRIPYVYKITRKDTGEYYYGSKYGVDANPKTFWIKYFTSSSVVYRIIECFGKEIFIPEIIQAFENPKDALILEQKLIKEYIKDEKNLNCGVGSINPDSNKIRRIKDPITGESSYQKAARKMVLTKRSTFIEGKNILQRHGENYSKWIKNNKEEFMQRFKKIDYDKKDENGVSLRKKLSLANLGKTLSEDTKKKISDGVKQWNKEHPEELKEGHKKMIETKSLVKEDGLTSFQRHSIFMKLYNPAKDKVWVNNGIKSKRVYEEDIEEGWALGRIHFDIVRTEKTCPYCGLTGKGPNMARYHFENCRKKRNNG